MIYDKLRRAAKIAVAKGYKLKPSYYANGDQVCAIGALQLACNPKGIDSTSEWAMNELGVDRDQLGCIIYGFDTRTGGSTYNDIGKDIRNEFDPI